MPSASNWPLLKRRSLAPFDCLLTTGMAAATDRSLLLHFFRDPQLFGTPQPIHAFEVHTKALLLEQTRDSSVPEPRRLARQLHHAPPQRRLITADPPTVTHAAARQPKAFACSTLRPRKLAANSLHALALLRRAHWFPRSASLSIALSISASVGRRFRREFSFSSSLSRLASSLFMPPYWFRQRW